MTSSASAGQLEFTDMQHEDRSKSSIPASPRSIIRSDSSPSSKSFADSKSTKVSFLPQTPKYAMSARRASTPRMGPRSTPIPVSMSSHPGMCSASFSPRMHSARNSLSFDSWLRQKARARAKLTRSQKTAAAAAEKRANERRAKARKEFCRWRRQFDNSRQSEADTAQKEAVSSALNLIMMRVQGDIAFKKWQSEVELRQAREKKAAMRRARLVAAEIAALARETEKQGAEAAEKEAKRLKDTENDKAVSDTEPSANAVAANQPKIKKRKLRKRSSSCTRARSRTSLQMPMQVGVGMSKRIPNSARRRRPRKSLLHTYRRHSFVRKYTRPAWNSDVYWPEYQAPGAATNKKQTKVTVTEKGKESGHIICVREVTAKVGSAHQIDAAELSKEEVKLRSKQSTDARRRRQFKKGMVSSMKGAEKWLQRKRASSAKRQPLRSARF